MQNDKTFTIKDPQGQIRTLTGNPDLLTLDDILVDVGKQGGQKWNPKDIRLKVGSQSFGETDLHRTFTEAGIEPGSVIEVIAPVNA